jgi:RNA polymerase sigma-70 factor, ECF subfamily
MVREFLPGKIMGKLSAEPTDQELVEDIKAGSMEAMEKIIQRYEKPLYTFGLRMCGQKQDAEDMAQDALLSAFRYLGRFRGETKLRNWLFKIASRACLRRRRKKEGEPDRMLSLDLPGDGGEKDGPYDIPDWSGDPSDRIIQKELKRIIDSAIQALPPKYRLVFTLRDVEGLSTEDTAEVLHITPQSVKTRLHRARLFLRSEISTRYKEAREP